MNDRLTVGLRAWKRRRLDCPVGRHEWVWSGEAMTPATSRYCQHCGASSIKGRRISADSSKVVRHVKVGTATMTRVIGTWGAPTGYEEE